MNSICERVIGTIRRECLDWLIPLSESHLRSVLKSWIAHYNTGRPHMALGPGVPDPPSANIGQPRPNSRYRRGESYAVRAKPILGGLHHEYFLAPTGTWLSFCGRQDYQYAVSGEVRLKLDDGKQVRLKADDTIVQAAHATPGTK